MTPGNPAILTCANSGALAVYVPDGQMARSNGDLVAEARAMAEDAGRRVATVAETRELLDV